MAVADKDHVNRVLREVEIEQLRAEVRRLERLLAAATGQAPPAAHSLLTRVIHRAKTKFRGR